MSLCQTNKNTLINLLKISKSLNQAQQIHQQITVSASLNQPITLTKLIQLYADSDDFISAHKLFDKIPQPNVYAWTSLYSLYLRHGMYEKCIQNYGLMKFSCVFPDNYVFPKVLRACAQLSWLEGGIWIHKDVIVCGFEFHLQVCNSLIDMYVKCGDVRSGRLVFEEMKERDLFSWNSMILGCVSNGLLESAVALLGCLRSDGLEADVVTWNTLMNAYCRLGRFDEAWEVFKQIEQPNIISWTTFISGYSKRGEEEMSLKVFRDMVTRGVVSPDLDCLCSVIISCRHLGALRSGKEVHGYGIKAKTNSTFYSSAGAALLTMYAKFGRIQDAAKVFEVMDKTDVVTWNAMILGFVELELEKPAIECFSEMLKKGLKANQTTISTILPVCCLQFGNQIHAYIRKSSSLSSVVTVWNAVIHMYCKCGCVRSAYSIFSSMATKDIVSWNTMIGGYGMHGHGQAALKLLRVMISSGICPDSTTLTCALSACSHSGFVDEGLELFHSITENYALTPRMEHYSCIVDLLARAGRFEEAISFIGKMPLHPDKSIWGALLASCQAYQNVDFGILAAEQLICLEPKCAGHYVTLSNIYARGGMWEDAVRVRKKMEGKGLIKPSGKSLIEIGN
ncbi:pentatricopeptide repeat-containing protein At5g39350-like [Mercurialis annua]|uniref:pentatricopeptide repeat-containing protein At5g39350-like n=1 Tax=Mercurialis annua TaxID=3986 RepID=UPI00215F9609|nr:pentatricopeptide repeat-containing protein At5g39350-like [Mercurialis annua]XP_050226546.1 pentatricopeptide repeat-containing protein At5g39350-like [Mercurialis annua]